uniref:VWFC domain-containing protein n=1 Tax=Anopheles minimus TaxID=112268 RepID=A0A182VUU0_9DIPT
MYTIGTMVDMADEENMCHHHNDDDGDLNEFSTVRRISLTMWPSESSCYYNGTHFMEGSIVPTKEPCLMCKCTEKTLICALKVCPEQPIPPPRGCILVHKAGSCCPYLQCSKLNLAVKNNGDRKKLHFLDYYEKAAQERLEKPNSYLRRSDDDEVEDNGACIINGTVYKSGSAMVSSTLCSYCYCINGRQKCVKPKCALTNQKCAPVFVDSACCPIRYDCSGKTPIKNSATELSTESANHVRRINNKHYQRMSERRGYRSNGCISGGHTYPDGEKMKSEDPCEVCYCIRGQRKCTPKKCAPAIKGCTPRVPRGECCAVRYDCKHGEQKPFGRKMEDEEESFDFFSILFGPDPDAPKEEAKNATKTIEVPVTEATPVSTTSEKSFLDLLRAGLDFIDDAGEDELLLSTTSASEGSTFTSTESPPELQTVKVEIIQEPQAIYIEKPDFNFPVRKIPPVPIMFKPLPKIPTLLMNEPNFQNLESDSLLKENPTEVSNSLSETTLKNVPTTDTYEDKTETEEIIITTTATERTTTPSMKKKQTSTTTMEPVTAKTTQSITEPAPTRPSTTTSTTTTTTTTSTTTETPTTTTTTNAPITTTTTTTTAPTTTSTTTVPSTTFTPPTTTVKQTTAIPLTTTVKTASSTTNIPNTEATRKVESSVANETVQLTTTITPLKKEVISTSTSPSLEADSFKTTTTIPSTSVSTSPTSTKTTTEYIRSTTTPQPSSTKKLRVSEKIVQTTPQPIVSSTPIDVVIKIDQLVDKQTVETILNSLNAKIEKVAKVTATEPITTTTIAIKRPNNKFVGFEPEKIPSTILSKLTTTTTESIDTTALMNDVTTSVASEGELTSTVAPDVTTTMRETTDRLTEPISTSTQRISESEESTLLTSTVPPETSTVQDDGSAEASTEMTDTTVNSYTETTHEELRTEPLIVESNDTLTTTETITSITPTKSTATVVTRPPNPLKENNLLSVLLSGLSNIFDATKNDSGKQAQKNRTEYRPISPKPIPISGFHKVSNIPSILESDIGLDYDEPTLPPSLPNLKIIPFLPADAVKKNEPPKPAKIVPPTYTYFKNHPNNYPIVNDPYETPSAYGLSNEHEILHPGLTYKAPGKPIAEYEYSYDPAINYPALTESYDVDAKNGYYNTKVIRDKYDTVDEMDYDYDTDTIHKYSEHPQKQDLFKNELKKFIPTKYEVPQEGTYVPVYDKYGVGYPEKNVYYTNHKEIAYGGAKLDKIQSSTDNPLFRIDGTDMSGFSPPTKTEGGFVPKEPIKDEFYYESYATTPFPIELTDEHHAKLPYNATPTSSYGVTPSNPFIDVIRTEPAPPLMSLIEDKEKLLSTLQSKNTSLEDLIGDPSDGSEEFEKQIISITTDSNYLSSASEEHVPTQRTTPSKPNFTGFELKFPVSVHHSEEPVSEATKPADNAGAEHEPEPSGMFSLENMLNYLLREEDPVNENKLRNSTASGNAGSLGDGIPPFKTLPSRLTAVYDPTVGLEASLGDVKPPSDEELHDGTVTLKVESAKNDTKTLYRPSLLDLPFLNPGFHTKPINQPESDPESQNELDRYGYGGTPEHRADQYQVIAGGTPGVGADSYVVNPVDINKLKQHHSEGTAEITMKSKVKDTVGILKLAGCNIYGRMYRVGRIISELSGPCLECKCTEVGVHCTPLDCRRRR